MEEVLAAHPDVAECAVVGVADDLKGQLPVGFVCLNNAPRAPRPTSCRKLVKLVRDRIGPVAAFKHAVLVDRLPKTRSGKILRADHGQDRRRERSSGCRRTIDDPAILDEIREALGRIGYGA